MSDIIKGYEIIEFKSGIIEIAFTFKTNDPNLNSVHRGNDELYTVTTRNNDSITDFKSEFVHIPEIKKYLTAKGYFYAERKNKDEIYCYFIPDSLMEEVE